MYRRITNIIPQLREGVQTMKRVLHIAEAFGGGVFTFLVALANKTCEEFDVTIAYTVRPQTPLNYKELIDPRVHLIEMKEVQRSINLVQDMKGAMEIRQIYKKVKPDFVHLHSSKAGFLGRLVINCRKTNVAYTPHGFAFLKEDDSPFVRMMYKTIEKIGALKGGAVIGVSKGEYEEALDLTNNAGFVNNGIELDPIKHLEIKDIDVAEGEKWKIGTLGRICYQKNPMMFNRVAEHFYQDRFLWIGSGEMADELQEANIRISGWKAHDLAVELLNNLDIFILPSLWEGLPISLLEAMYLKKICIVSNVVGNRDVIIHGVNGFIAETKEDYIKIIQNIKDGKYDIQAIAERAHNDVLSVYNVDVMCAKYAKIYDSDLRVGNVGWIKQSI